MNPRADLGNLTERERDGIGRLFRNTFSCDPGFVICAPGRVNLIGDHTDYNGLPVFPMAIQRRIIIAGRRRDDDAIHIKHLDPSFSDVKMVVQPDMAPHSTGSWVNYVKAGVRAVTAEYDARIGFDAVISSDIPIAAGLSSSSAMVVGFGLVTSHVNDLAIEALVMMDLMARAERFVGTMGGGMDQAACLGGREGMAMRIDFDPLAMVWFDVPTDWRFVVASSMERAEKSKGVRALYNERGRSCRRALETIVHGRGGTGESASYKSLYDDLGFERFLAEGEQVLDERELMRFRHTVSETRRVDCAAKAMVAGARERFGQLMNASHRSLAEDYEVTTPALDMLVEIMREAGADGARLTGAGFGGCAVALCHVDRVEGIMSALADGFFEKRGAHLDDVAFVAHPSDGASVRQW